MENQCAIIQKCYITTNIDFKTETNDEFENMGFDGREREILSNSFNEVDINEQTALRNTI